MSCFEPPNREPVPAASTIPEIMWRSLRSRMRRDLWVASARGEAMSALFIAVIGCYVVLLSYRKGIPGGGGR
jgi:hypothetical protein